MRHATALMIVLLGVVIAVAPLATAMAQPGGSPAAPQTAPANPSGAPGADAAPPTPPAGGDERADNPPASPMPERASDLPAPRNDAAENRAAPADDTAAASPRTGDTDATRVFGLPMPAALVIGGALILALMLIVVFSRVPAPGPRERLRDRRR